MARYFVILPQDGSPGMYRRRLAGFAGESIHINLNLLAHAVGDDPATLLPVGARLAPAQDYFDYPPGGVGTRSHADKRASALCVHFKWWKRRPSSSLAHRAKTAKLPRRSTKWRPNGPVTPVL